VVYDYVWVVSKVACNIARTKKQARDKKCLEGQTFRCKPCHVPNFD
jgi:hypothetical protein